jgi:hypothetical protein
MKYTNILVLSALFATSSAEFHGVAYKELQRLEETSSDYASATAAATKDEVAEGDSLRSNDA